MESINDIVREMRGERRAEMANKQRKRRRACDCAHFHKSAYDGRRLCVGYCVVRLGGEDVRVHMTGECTGVCGAWVKREVECNGNR